MAEELTNAKKDQLYSVLEFFTIILLAIVPLFLTFPYRVNIFLSWEGAYRLSQGQVPFRDFGIPMGYMYWVIPAFFFKIFGTQMITLIKAQVLINIISGLAFRSIIKSLSVHPGLRYLSVLLYCVSFSFFNFWPWYNHTVIVYEMVALAFLMHYIFSENRKWITLSLSALFIFFSFFTKQDGGALAFLICILLLAGHCIYERKWTPLLIFLASAAVAAFALIAPLMRYSFGYWFNHGQPPHTSRVYLFDILDEFLYSSQWIKFYLFMIAVILLATYKSIRGLLMDKRNFIFLLLTLGILMEAAVLQISSYTPPDNNIFFHSFAFVFIFSNLGRHLKIDWHQVKLVTGVALLMMIWWSGVYWKYISGTVQNILPEIEQDQTSENIVNRHTYILSADSKEIPMGEWTYSTLRSFKKIRMPRSTVEGMDRLLQLPLVRNNKDLHVLNMTELTPLAVEMPYRSETGNVPLWYHLGVSMFNKEAEAYEKKLVHNQYDLVLFEYVPSLNNFYPFRVRDTLLKHYEKIDSFAAPRRGITQGIIEIFVRK